MTLKYSRLPSIYSHLYGVVYIPFIVVNALVILVFSLGVFKFIYNPVVLSRTDCLSTDVMDHKSCNYTETLINTQASVCYHDVQ